MEIQISHCSKIAKAVQKFNSIFKVVVVVVVVVVSGGRPMGFTPYPTMDVLSGYSPRPGCGVLVLR